MANEFKIKNALKILNTHAVTGISNSLSVFDTYDTSSLVTAAKIRSFVEDSIGDTSIWYVDSSVIKQHQPSFPVELGKIQKPVDSGDIVLADMEVSSTPSSGTEESYSLDIDGNSIITLYSESDGAGGISKEALVVDVAYQYMGQPDTDNSWRFFVDSSADLVFEMRLDGTWKEGGKFSVFEPPL